MPRGGEAELPVVFAVVTKRGGLVLILLVLV